MRVSEFWSEASQSVRSLIQRPTFSGLSVLLLSLSVAAVTAIFAVIDTAILRPLPYRDAEALHQLFSTEPVTRDSTQSLAVSAWQLELWRDQSRAFSGVEGYTPSNMKLLGLGDPQSINGAFVSAGLFDLLGWAPRVGRSFRRDEEAVTPTVAVISYGLWERNFGRDPRVVGRTLNMNDLPLVVVGILPEGFALFSQPADLFVPMAIGTSQHQVRTRTIAAYGRLKPGVTIEQGTADLVSINRTLAAEMPDDYRATGASVVPIREALYGAQRGGLIVLGIAVLVLVAIGAVNLLSLSLADSVARRSTILVRLALGARPRVIARHRLMDMVVLAVVASGIGLAVGWGVLAALRTIGPDTAVALGSVSGTVVIVAVLVAGTVGVVAALPTALLEARLRIVSSGGVAARSTSSREERLVRNVLLGSQATMAVILLVAAGLFGRNVRHLMARPTGLRPANVAVVEMTLSRQKYETKEARAQYVERLLEAVGAVPGVAAVATDQTRFRLNETMQSSVEVEGSPADLGLQQVTQIRHTTPALFDVLGIRLQRGRAISAQDRAETPLVAVVSESFARQYLGGAQQALGRRIRRKNAPWMEVVGIVDDVADAGLGVSLGPTMYVSYLQQNTPTARVSLLVRGRSAVTALFPSIRRAVQTVDVEQPIDAMDLVEQRLLRSAAQPRFQSLVSTLFAAAALGLVLAGIYAMTLFGVVRRTRELGVRSALGAAPGTLVRETLAQAMAPVVVGIVVGTAIAIPAARAMQQLLKEGLTSGDAPLFAALALAFATVAAAAAWIPARRSLRVPPSEALRA
ncbi:MAG: ABC transporter permease [Gemmatimonadaceae bacterium]